MDRKSHHAHCPCVFSNRSWRWFSSRIGHMHIVFLFHTVFHAFQGSFSQQRRVCKNHSGTDKVWPRPCENFWSEGPEDQQLLCRILYISCQPYLKLVKKFNACNAICRRRFQYQKETNPIKKQAFKFDSPCSEEWLTVSKTKISWHSNSSGPVNSQQDQIGHF